MIKDIALAILYLGLLLILIDWLFLPSKVKDVANELHDINKTLQEISRRLNK